MFQKFSNSWELAKESYGVLKQDREMMVFPVLSAVMTFLLLASFFIPAATMIDWSTLDTEAPTTKVLGLFLTFVFYFIGYFVVLFCNTALLHCAKMRFSGGDPTVKDGFQAGMANLGRIAAWAAIGGTIGVILAQLEERLGALGGIVRSLVGGAWTVVTYFAVPVMIFEQLSPMESIKRSKDIIYKTWGEAAVAAVGMRSAQGGFFFLGFLVLVGGIFAGIATEQMALAGVGLAGALLLWIGSAIVFSCLTQIYRAALYVYATTGEPPKAFAGSKLESAFNG
jgi:hypothetical protein